MKTNTQFKKGQTPWNKGTKGLQVGWSKGKKMDKPAWNKGLKTKPHTEETKKKMSLARNGSKHPNWKGGIRIDTNGYRLIRVATNKYKFEHHLVIEGHIGRGIRNNEIPHHINFDKLDNRLENLYLFRNRASHVKYHAFLKRNDLNGTNSGLTSNLYIHQIV